MADAEGIIKKQFEEADEVHRLLASDIAVAASLARLADVCARALE